MFGSLPWADVVLPAVDIAYNGFPVNYQLVLHMDEFGSDIFTTDPSWAIDFAPNGTRLGIGDIITRKRYAAMLDAIAKHGAPAFYEGAIAQATIAALDRAAGIMTMDDLANYAAIERQPVSITYRDYRLASIGAPSGGIVTLNIMKTVEGYSDFGTSASANLSTFRLNEAFRFGYGAVGVPN